LFLFEFEAVFAAFAGLGEAAVVLWGFGDDGRDGDAIAAGVDGDEGQIGGGSVADGAAFEVLHIDLDADFHGRAEDAIDAGLENDEIADVDGQQERHVINGRGDDGHAGVAKGGGGGGDIDEVHDAATDEVAEGIGVIGESHFGVERLGVAHGAAGERGVHSFHYGAGWRMMEER
jgi:hypothetical protein